MTITSLPGTDVIDVTQLEAMRAADPSVRILDVRTGGEFAIAHIPGSYNVPLDTLSEHALDLASLEHPVVLVCQSGGRATKAHEHLTTAGKDRLHILEGGMNAWIGAERDVVRGDSSQWPMDRQVRLVAGSIALAGIVASLAVPKAKWIAGGVAGGLVFSAVTNTCAMGNLLMKLPYNRTDACDIAGVLEDMREAA